MFDILIKILSKYEKKRACVLFSWFPGHVILMFFTPGPLSVPPCLFLLVRKQGCNKSHKSTLHYPEVTERRDLIPDYTR